MKQLCACGYSHQDFCGGEICDECSSCGSLTVCDECAGDELERKLLRDEELAAEDRELYGI